MEPFVPTPEERISHKDPASAKNRVNGGAANPNGGGGPPSGFARHIPLAVVTAIFAALLLWSSQRHGAQIESLNQQLASLSKAAAPQVQADDTAEESEDGIDTPKVPTERLAAVETKLGEQVSELETLRMMVSETLSKLDADLEGTLTSNARRNREAIVALQESLKTLQSELKNSTAKVAQGSNDALKKLQSSIVEIKNSVSQEDRSLSGQVSELTSRFANLSPLSDRVAEVDKRLVSLEQSVQRADSQVASLADNQAKVNARTQALGKSVGELDKALSSVDETVNELNSGIASLQGGQSVLDKRVAQVEADGKTLRTLASALESKQQATDKKLASLTSSLNGKATIAQLDSKTSGTQKALAQLSSQVDRLAGQVDKSMAALSTQQTTLAALKNSTASTPAGAGPSASVDGGSIREFRDRLASYGAALEKLQAANKGVSKDLSIASTQLLDLRGDVKKLQNKVNTTGGGVSSVAVASADLAPLKQEVAQLSGEVSRSLALISRQETQLGQWRRAIESQLSTASTDIQRLAAQAADRGAGADPDQLNYILSTIRVLKKQHPYAEFND